MISTLFVDFIVSACSNSSRKNTIDMNDWIVEDHSGELGVQLKNDTFDIISPDGLTLWYNKELTGEYAIEYDIMMVMNGGVNDRLSDLNCFWAAKDPKFPQDILARSEWRDGVFSQYNSLRLFYVGYGGNHNTTTRFRNYRADLYPMDSDSLKLSIHEYTDTENLLKPNHWYSIRIIMEDEQTTYSVNGKPLFSKIIREDDKTGYFGLRLLTNHVLFRGFRITRL